jgi:hypothetical protein
MGEVAAGVGVERVYRVESPAVVGPDVVACAASGSGMCRG